MEVRPLTPDDFPEVYDKYLASDDARLTREDWRRLFEPARPLAECCGYGLFAGGQVVGMVGMLFSERTINGQQHRFCNLHSWKVDQAHRGGSLSLMRPALNLRGCTLTDFTPTPQVSVINQRLGFRPLDSRVTLLFCPWRRSLSEPSVAILTDLEEIVKYLNQPQAQISRDHPGPDFEHLLVEAQSQSCYVIAARVTRHWLPYCHVYYVSDPAVFRRFQDSICRHLLEITRTRFAAVDARRMGLPRLPRSFTVPLSSNQFYRSDDVAPADIDPLYSELSYLRLTTLPGKRQIIQSIKRFCRLSSQ